MNIKNKFLLIIQPINLKIAIVQKINVAGNNIIDCEAGRRGTA